MCPPSLPRHARSCWLARSLSFCFPQPHGLCFALPALSPAVLDKQVAVFPLIQSRKKPCRHVPIAGSYQSTDRSHDISTFISRVLKLTRLPPLGTLPDNSFLHSALSCFRFCGGRNTECRDQKAVEKNSFKVA